MGIRAVGRNSAARQHCSRCRNPGPRQEMDVSPQGAGTAPRPAAQSGQPPFLMETELVHATGVLEVMIAVALFRARWRLAGAWAALLVLVAFFPANIHAALHHAPMGGHAWGPAYLLVRAPLQLFIIAWIWLRSVRVTAPAATSAHALPVRTPRPGGVTRARSSGSET